MKTNVEERLDKIADIWNYFIWDYKFCSSKIKFNDDVKTNYFGDIFDVILTKLKNILDEYVAELLKLENVIINQDFNTVLRLVELYFEAFFKSDFVYDKNSILKIYERKQEHKRYENFIELFYNDLRNSISEKKRSVSDIFDRKKINFSEVDKMNIPNVEILFTDSVNSEVDDKPKKENYHYEIGKIGSKRNPMDFDFFGGILRKKCLENELVLNELNHMEQNIWDEIEYYTSYRLICSELKEE
jgi:hypothetical protein